MTNKVVNSKKEHLELELGDVDERILFGYNSEYLRTIELEFSTKIVARGNNIKIFGTPEDIERTRKVLQYLTEYVQMHENLPEYVVDNSIAKTKGRETLELKKTDERILISSSNGPIRPKTNGQAKYVQAIDNNDIVFVIGPAGTGKTYLAVACAVRKLKERLIDRIILVRPAVEAGEELGFLPGDMKEKVDPYLRPLFDAMYDMLPKKRVDRYTTDGTIEVAPLAFMRGRSLNNAFIVVDEAQNATVDQMKMLLTRIGVNSSAVITGDITQIDLHHKNKSGLIQCQYILKGLEDIEFVYLNKEDVVRHKVVKRIIQAFQDFEEKKNKKSDKE